MSPQAFAIPRLPVKQGTFVLLIAILLSLLGAAQGTRELESTHAHPELLRLAASDPGRPVAVIIQKHGIDSQVEQLVLQLGGVITRELRIINAFAATITAAAIPTLARADGVKWISPEGPLAHNASLQTTAAHAVGLMARPFAELSGRSPSSEAHRQQRRGPLHTLLRRVG